MSSSGEVDIPETSGGFAAVVRSLVPTTPINRAKAALASVAMVLLIALVLLPYQPRSLVVTIDSPVPGSLQLYFDQGEGLSEYLSVRLPYKAGTSQLSYRLPVGSTKFVRIDPAASTPSLTIQGIAATVPTGSPVQTFDPHSLTPAYEIVSTEDTADGGRKFLIKEGSNDPQIAFSPSQAISSSEGISGNVWLYLWSGFLLASIITALLHFRPGRLVAVSVCVAALAMSLCMAMFSPTAYSVHPDEPLHNADATYFHRHWLPPRLDSAELATNYKSSVYGVTYLGEWNITYLLAGKVGKLFMATGLSQVVAYRLFNVGLFALVILGLVLSRAPPGAYLAILITPQLWYAFSYFNGDAFPFALSCVAAAIALQPDGAFARYLRQGGRVGAQVVAFITLFGLLLIAKKNYLPVAAFIAVATAAIALQLRPMVALSVLGIAAVGAVTAAAGGALAQTYGTSWFVIAGSITLLSLIPLARFAVESLRDRTRWPILGRIALVFSLAVVVASPWIAVDVARNGFSSEKASTAIEMRERYATPQMKPSSVVAETSPTSGFNLNTKGVLLPELFSPERKWHVGTFHSFFGAYGYMEYFGSERSYALAGWVSGLLLLAAIAIGMANGTLSATQLILSIGFSAILIFTSALHSWTYHFQPQGRYVLGVLVMTMPIFMAASTSGRNRVFFVTACLAMFCISALSFMNVAMANLI